MPHPTPVKILPKYSIEWFFAKKIKSHPSSKGMAPSMMANFRPVRSTAFPPMILPDKAPTAIKDCNKKIDFYDGKQYGRYQARPSHVHRQRLADRERWPVLVVVFFRSGESALQFRGLGKLNA